MGVGAAASEPGTLSMLRHMYTGERMRDTAVGLWTAVCGLALAMGPVIGGALVGIWDWRAIVWFNLAFGAAALALGAAVLPESADPDAHRVDITGAVLGAAALSALIFAVISAEMAGFAAPDVIALLSLSAAAGVLFCWHETRTAHPLLDLRYLRVPRFLTANVVAFCAGCASSASRPTSSPSSSTQSKPAPCPEQPGAKRRHGHGSGKARAGRHPRRIQRVLLGPARCAVPVGGTGPRSRAVRSRRGQEQVFDMFTDPRLLVRWMGISADLRPQP